MKKKKPHEQTNNKTHSDIILVLCYYALWGWASANKGSMLSKGDRSFRQRHVR